MTKKNEEERKGGARVVEQTFISAARAAIKFLVNAALSAAAAGADACILLGGVTEAADGERTAAGAPLVPWTTLCFKRAATGACGVVLVVLPVALSRDPIRLATGCWKTGGILCQE